VSNPNPILTTGHPVRMSNKNPCFKLCISFLFSSTINYNFFSGYSGNICMYGHGQGCRPNIFKIIYINGEQTPTRTRILTRSHVPEIGAHLAAMQWQEFFP